MLLFEQEVLVENTNHFKNWSKVTKKSSSHFFYQVKSNSLIYTVENDFAWQKLLWQQQQQRNNFLSNDSPDNDPDISL